MEGESAIQAVFGSDATKPENAAAVDAMRADYEHQLDARFAAARGYVDALMLPETTRDTLAFLLEVTAGYSGPHLGAFTLPRAHDQLRLSLRTAVLSACAPAPSDRSSAARRRIVSPAPAAADVAPVVAVPRPSAPVVPPPLALLAGLMPLRSTGVEQFRAAHPSYDGRGVLIGILDSGIDPGVAGLVVTSTGAPKILDLRDFSGEGRVTLDSVRPQAGALVIAGRTLRGSARIGRLATGATWYAGVFRELPLGPLPAADVNGNGTNTDAFRWSWCGRRTAGSSSSTPT
jgi:hypothetical protein